MAESVAWQNKMRILRDTFLTNSSHFHYRENKGQKIKASYDQMLPKVGRSK